MSFWLYMKEEKLKRVMLYWNWSRGLKKFILFFLCGICIWITIACAYENDHTPDIGTNEISQEIDEYVMKFMELYSSNALEDTKSKIIIEEEEFPSDNENGALFTKYSDLSGKNLRYKIIYYGETGNTIINYYLCENFVWISRQINHYSSWILTEGYSDILYSEIDNWIIMGETAYVMYDNGDLEEILKTQLKIPLLEEIL